MEPLIAILAGGRGGRVGGSKALLELCGRPLIDYPVSAALEAGDRVEVFAKDQTSLPPLPVPVVRETAEPRHPLAGIVAALDAAGGGPVLALACDLPFVTTELLRWLAAQGEPLIVPEVGGRLQPLLGRYEPSLAGALRAACDAGQPAQETVRALSPRVVGEAELRPFGDPARLLFNVNTPDDLAEAERLLGD